MANADIPRGLAPVCYRGGAVWNGAARRYYVPSTYATALYRGDPVIVVTAASDANGVPSVVRATAAGGNYVTGAMIGVISAGEPVIAVTRDSTTYHAASTAGYILVADDPDLLFEIQEDGIGGAMGINASNRNADLVAGTGSTSTGWSGFELDSSTLATTNTLQLRIIESIERMDNDATLTNAKWLVAINLHSQRNLTGI